MDKNYKIHFKECSPEKTVEFLKNKLNELNIKVEEDYFLKSSIGTYSLRVNFKGTSFGANGKGVSESYCKASAYAELFERFQNATFPPYYFPRQDEPAFYEAFDKRIKTTPEIVAENSPFIQFYFRHRNLQDADFCEKVDSINSVQRMDYLYSGRDNEYACLPFYSVKDDTIYYLPYTIYYSYYGSNGMAAGNTAEEAIVQGYSEILERVAQKRIFLEKPVLPDIPEDYLKEYPYIYEIFTKLKRSEKYDYYLKDCSFGGEYPVAALIVVEKNTGRYGIKLGCHPSYGIALERCFTEATQGRDISEYANSSVIDFSNTEVDGEWNISNSYKIGHAQFPYQIFGANPDYEFFAFENHNTETNETLLEKWTNYFVEKGYDVLIRNVSHIDFPSFHIIIPGLSELQNADDRKVRALNTRVFVRDLLSNPEQINTNNIKYIITCLKYFEKNVLENNISLYYDNYKFNYPGAEIGKDLKYMLAMCYAFVDEYRNASNCMYEVYTCAISNKVDFNRQKIYGAIYHYFTAMESIKNHEKAIGYVEKFYDTSVCDFIKKVFLNKKSIFLEQYPTNTKTNSEIRNLDELRDKLFHVQAKKGISQYDLRKYFVIDCS